MLVELPILAWLAESPGVTAIEMLVRLKATPAGPGSGSQCALDSLEEAGFELSVPPDVNAVGCYTRDPDAKPLIGSQG
jgi:hypothetical protein